MKKLVKAYLAFCVATNLLTLVCPPARRWAEEKYLPRVMRLWGLR